MTTLSQTNSWDLSNTCACICLWVEEQNQVVWLPDWCCRVFCLWINMTLCSLVKLSVHFLHWCWDSSKRLSPGSGLVVMTWIWDIHLSAFCVYPLLPGHAYKCLITECDVPSWTEADHSFHPAWSPLIACNVDWFSEPLYTKHKIYILLSFIF